MTIKHLLISVFLLCCMPMLSAPSDNDPLSALEGTWYVHMSNFKMWLKGNKHHPAFIYTIQTRKGIRGFRDVVRYTKHGKTKQIVGFDRPENEQATSFTWRGKGLLALFKSKWEIVYQTDEWVLIHFQKTLATAEGYDVISRKKRFDPETIAAIQLKLKELGISGLKDIPQE